MKRSHACPLDGQQRGLRLHQFPFSKSPPAHEATGSRPAYCFCYRLAIRQARLIISKLLTNLRYQCWPRPESDVPHDYLRRSPRATSEHARWWGRRSPTPIYRIAISRALHQDYIVGRKQLKRAYRDSKMYAIIGREMNVRTASLS